MKPVGRSCILVTNKPLSSFVVTYQIYYCSKWITSKLTISYATWAEPCLAHVLPRCLFSLFLTCTACRSACCTASLLKAHWYSIQAYGIRAHAKQRKETSGNLQTLDVRYLMWNLHCVPASCCSNAQTNKLGPAVMFCLAGSTRGGPTSLLFTQQRCA